MISDFWMIGFGLTPAIGSIGTAIAVYFVYRQTSITDDQLKLNRQQTDSSLRPWLGVFEEGLHQAYSNALLKITNYGSLPTTSWKWTIKTDDKKIIKSHLESLKNRADAYEATAIFPNQHFDKVIQLEEGTLDSVRKREQSLFVGVLIEYKYASNNVGESGMIFEFDKSTLKFGFSEVWAE
jgi:hypothetical protein